MLKLEFDKANIAVGLIGNTKKVTYNSVKIFFWSLGSIPPQCEMQNASCCCRQTVLKYFLDNLCVHTLGFHLPIS